MITQLVSGSSYLFSKSHLPWCLFYYVLNVIFILLDIPEISVVNYDFVEETSKSNYVE